MTQLNFEKVEVGTKLNFSKDLGVTASENVLTFNGNWGKINNRPVDLDVVLVLKDTSGNVVSKPKGFLKSLFGSSDTAPTAGTIVDSYYTRLLGGKEVGPGIKHHGDDTTGSSDGGEFIEVDTDKLPENVNELVFSIFSFSGHSFGALPFASVKVHTGAYDNPGRGLVSMDLTGFSSSTKTVAVAKFVKNSSGEWVFEAIQNESSKGSISEVKRLSEVV